MAFSGWHLVDGKWHFASSQIISDSSGLRFVELETHLAWDSSRLRFIELLRRASFTGALWARNCDALPRLKHFECPLGFYFVRSIRPSERVDATQNIISRFRVGWQIWRCNFETQVLVTLFTEKCSVGSNWRWPPSSANDYWRMASDLDFKFIHQLTANYPSPTFNSYQEVALQTLKALSSSILK